VSPTDPTDAVLDRDIRWFSISFWAFFAFTAGPFGLLLVFMAMHTLFSPRKPTRHQAATLTSAQNSADLSRDDHAALPLSDVARWHVDRVEQSRESSLLYTWFFTIVWNGASFPVYFGLVIFGDNEFGLLKIVTSVFPSAGIVLLWFAVQDTMRFLRAPRD
jgi:hypothetical protein